MGSASAPPPGMWKETVEEHHPTSAFSSDKKQKPGG